MINRVRITQFSFDESLSGGYLELCNNLYSDDPNWIQPLRKRVLSQFDPGFPFYQNPQNRHRHFVATHGGKIVGYLSAFVNTAMRDLNGGKVGGLGFFECTNDYDVAEGLLSSAAEWLQVTNHVDRIWGPVNFDIWHGYRFMTRGFGQPTFYGEPYNKAYYPEFFQKYGFETLKSWCSLELTGRTTWESMVAKYQTRHQRVIAAGYRLQQANMGDPHVVAMLHRLISRSYHHFLAYTPIGLDEFKHFIGTFLNSVDARFLYLIHDKENHVVGFNIAYPDVADAIRSMHGGDNLLARMRFHKRRRSARRMIYSSLGISPEEVRKRHGLGAAITYQTIHDMLDAGYETGILTLIGEDSPVRAMVGERIGHAQRAYALFELVIK